MDPKIGSMMHRWFAALLLAAVGCAAQPVRPSLPLESIARGTLWVPVVRNTTDADLRVPAANPLRSLSEIAGIASADERPRVIELLRAAIKRELEKRTVRVRFPEEHDRRLSVLPLGSEAAARVARNGALEGALLLSEIRRWEIEAPDPMRVWVEFKLVRIADGATLWERSVQKIIPATRTGNVAENYNDAVRAVVDDLL